MPKFLRFPTLALGLSLLLPVLASAQVRFPVSGTVKDARNGEDLIGATVLVAETRSGAATNAYGFYSLSLVPGTYTLLFSSVGYTAKTVTVTVANAAQTLNVELATGEVALEEVVVTGNRPDANVQDITMSSDKLNIEAIKTLPAFLGEVDILKTLQLLPGVQSAGEGSGGFHVRGGSIDQNLILLDEAPVYNASHLLGFFSVFNADAIKDVQIYKGGIPAEYGGRLSSLVDIRMKEGNNKKFAGSGGVGTIASRLTLEGPLVKDRSSFMLAGRRTYADLFLLASRNEDRRNTKLYFYDFNSKANYRFNDRNRLFLSGYFGRDVFKFSDQFRLTWGNATGTARWNHLFSEKLFANFTFIYSDFDYSIGAPSGSAAFEWKSRIRDLSGKADLTWYPSTGSTVRFGVHSIHHNFNPGRVESDENSSAVNNIILDPRYALEHAAYVSHDWNITNRLTVQYGLRWSAFQNLGGKSYTYAFENPAINAGEYTITGSREYDRFETYLTQGGPEPRLAVRYSLGQTSSIKASYNRTLQYIHLVSNSVSASPLDVYIPSSQRIKPQIANQGALGYFRNFGDNAIETSVEVYYKEMQNLPDFIDNAELFLNNHVETQMLSGNGTAYGLELSAKKQTGRLTGWASYTLSRTDRRVNGINNNQTYLARYDKPHNVNFVSGYQLSPRIQLGLNFTYSSGFTATVPVGGYRFGNTVVPVYSERNAYRLPAYHRLDLSLTLEGKRNKERRWQSSWNFSVYNAYGRRNAYSINFKPNADDPSKTEAVRLSIMGAPIPAVTYNFKF